MIKVKFGDHYVEVKGHANFKKHGEDIVCSAVSTLVFAFINSTDCKNIKISNGYTYLEHTSDKDTLSKLDMLKRGIEMVENEFLEYVRIE